MQPPRNMCLSTQVDLPAASNQQQHSALLEAIIRQAPQARCLTSLAIRQLLPLSPAVGGDPANEVPPPLPPAAPPPVLSLGAACRLVSALPELRHLELPGTLAGGLSGVERLLGSVPVRGRLETLILGDLAGGGSDHRLSVNGGVGEDDEAGEAAKAADAGEASGGRFSSVHGQSTRLTLSRCDLARAVALMGGSDGAALRCLARLGLHLTLQPDPHMTHCFYVKDIEPQAVGAATAAGAGGAAAGAGGAAGQLQPAYDGSGGAVLLDYLSSIRLGGGGAGLISLVPADTLSVGFLNRLPPGSLGAGKAAAEVLKALGAAGLRCRRLLLDVGGDAQHDGHFLHDAAAAATTHLTPLVLCTSRMHLVSWGNFTSATARLLTMYAPESLASALKASGGDIAHLRGSGLLQPFICIEARVEANALYNLEDQVRVPYLHHG